MKAVAIAVAVGVYPRVCGGTWHINRGQAPDEGLSPRVRGNRVAAGEIEYLRRSIPACAGEPGGHFVNLSSPEVYPRVCGGTRWSVKRRKY